MFIKTAKFSVRALSKFMSDHQICSRQTVQRQCKGTSKSITSVVVHAMADYAGQIHPKNPA